MKADTLTPRDIFGKDVRYLIPLFQRPYVWNRQQHWEPLWDDVVVVAERLLDELDLTDKPAEAEQNTPPHFLGAVVVDQQLVSVANFDARQVIDGQQRLTTLQLLMDAAQEVVEELGDPMDAKLLSRLVVNDADLTKNEEDVFKVWPTNADREAFVAAMTNGAPIPKQHQDAPIVEAHGFFRDAVEAWAGPDDDPDKRKARLNSLTSVLRGLLRLVVIDLEPHDNAQVIFETLNARGTPLLASDLIKNLVLQEASDAGEDVEALYENEWRQFDGKPWRKEIRQGRLKRPRIDAFLNYWLVMTTTREVPSHQLYPLFRSHLRATRDPAGIMREVRRHGDVYDAFEDFHWATIEGAFMYRWRVMEQAVFTPLLLKVFAEPADVLSPAQRRKALRSLESWLVRRMICRLTTQDYNRFQLDMLEVLGDTDPSEMGDIVAGFLAAQEADSRFWPSDEDVAQALMEEEVYRRLKRARLRMILEGVEDHLRSPKSEEDRVRRGRLTIEHIMPQTWEINWPLDEPELTYEVVKARRSHLVHTIGNLTLVNEKLNPALSNAPWERKRGELAEHSVLKLNHTLLRDHPDRWDEDGISERSRWFADHIVDIWPSAQAFTGGSSTP